MNVPELHGLGILLYRGVLNIYYSTLLLITQYICSYRFPKHDRIAQQTLLL